MIITFIGHSSFCEVKKYGQILISMLKEKIQQEHVELFLGGYGNFDEFAYSCGQKLKKDNFPIKLTFVTPYITESYQKNNIIGRSYDDVVYPELENVPYRFAITIRNKWMINNSDLIIAYVNHRYGGAFKSYQYALRKRKKIINFGNIN